MATFKRFEEMTSWKSVRELVGLVYDVTVDLHMNVPKVFVGRKPGFQETFGTFSQMNSTYFDEHNKQEEIAPYSLELPDDL